MTRPLLALLALLSLSACFQSAQLVAEQRERNSRVRRADSTIADERASLERERRYQAFLIHRAAAARARFWAVKCETEVALAVQLGLRARRERWAVREAYFSCVALMAGRAGDLDAAQCLIELAHGAVRGGGDMCGAPYAASATATVTCGAEPAAEVPGPLLAGSSVRDTTVCAEARAAGLR